MLAFCVLFINLVGCERTNEWDNCCVISRVVCYNIGQQFALVESHCGRKHIQTVHTTEF
jgi:hypothetical protein